MIRVARLATVGLFLACVGAPAIAAEELLADFAKARNDPGKREQLVDQAIAQGGTAPAQLLAVLNNELRPKVRVYSQHFGKAALAVARDRANSTDAEEVSRLRAAVLDLGKQPDLTQEAIVSTADPALQKLATILLPDRDVVGRSSTKLVKQRAALVEAGKLWEKCAAAAGDLAAKTEKRPMPPAFENILKAEENVGLLLSGPLDSQTREILTTNAKVATKLDTEERRAIAALNFTRSLLGLPVLVIDPLLCQTARDHSHDMAIHGFFSHESPLEGKITPWDRAKRFGVAASAENIAVGIPQGIMANELWFHSPGHHLNMLGEHARVGVGRSGVHWTQMFGK